MDWNRVLLCALVCALVTAILTSGCMNGDQQASVGTGPDDGPPAGNMSGPAFEYGPPAGNMTGGMPEIPPEAFEEQIAALEALGFDLSEVRAAMDAGDPSAAQEAFRTFITEHRDEIPGGMMEPPQGEGV